MTVFADRKAALMAYCRIDQLEDGEEALLEGLADGTIDMIATDHAPHSTEEKSRGLEKSAMGCIGPPWAIWPRQGWRSRRPVPSAWPSMTCAWTTWCWRHTTTGAPWRGRQKIRRSGEC